MNAITFLVQNVVNPTTGETSKRLAVRFDNCTTVRVFLGDDTLEDTITAIKADKPGYLKKVNVKTGEFGPYVMFSKAETLEEI